MRTYLEETEDSKMSFRFDLQNDLRKIRKKIDREKNIAKKSKLIRAYTELLKTLET